MLLAAVFTPVAPAGLLHTSIAPSWRRWSLAALLVVYVQIWWHLVPHRTDGSQIEPDLVAHLRGLDGALVVFENTPHRDMDADPSRATEPPPVPAHVESILPRLTGRRLHAGMWDSWQWCPQRRDVLSGGAFRGTSIALTPISAVHDELARWGVRHAIVWSRASTEAFDRDPAAVRRWTSPPWVHYELTGADKRDVIVTTGGGRLTARTALGARVELTGVHAGDRVVIRTHFYPAWTAWHDDKPVPLVNDDGQLAFDAPRDGSYAVELRYPKRTWLLFVALGSVVAGAVGLDRLRSARERG